MEGFDKLIQLTNEDKLTWSSTGLLEMRAKLKEKDVEIAFNGSSIFFDGGKNRHLLSDKLATDLLMAITKQWERAANLRLLCLLKEV